MPSDLCVKRIKTSSSFFHSLSGVIENVLTDEEAVEKLSRSSHAVNKKKAFHGLTHHTKTRESLELHLDH
jgi:hypothetical protein